MPIGVPFRKLYGIRSISQNDVVAGQRTVKLAADGADLILVVRRKTLLQAYAEQIRNEHQVSVNVLAVDLGILKHRGTGITEKSSELELCVLRASVF